MLQDLHDNLDDVQLVHTPLYHGRNRNHSDQQLQKYITFLYFRNNRSALQQKRKQSTNHKILQNLAKIYLLIFSQMIKNDYLHAHYIVLIALHRKFTDGKQQLCESSLHYISCTLFIFRQKDKNLKTTGKQRRVLFFVDLIP